VEFAILGPLKVIDGDRDLTPRRAKQRALLAMLLLHPDEVVAKDQLVEALWGESPPVTADAALHGHVSALRKLLGARRIETQAPGYLLRVHPGELDLARFQSLVADARRVEPEERSRRLGAALALWRGDPLADLRYESFTQREIARLSELRLAVLEDRLDADLALGRHHELIVELEPLVAEHPFRERLRGQLMLAHYRCGRQADALHVYQDGHRTLVEELGINPGQALQQLQQRILNQDPSLSLSPQERLDTAAPATGPPAAVRLDLGEERKLATILLADVSAAATSGTRLDPERLRAVVRSYTEVVSEIIATWGGTLDQRMGDTMMVVFGVPAVREDDATRAIRTALELLERVDNLNRTFEERHGITLTTRIGIATGEVIAQAGSQAGEQLVVGDAVNVAARLQHAADPGTILVSDRTYTVTRRTFRFGDPVDPDPQPSAKRGRAYPVQRAQSRLGPGRPAFEAPFIGRRRELDRLAGLLDEAVRTGTTRLVLVYGTAGIGKSRLVRELLAVVLERYPAVAVLKGRCLAAGRGITYWALGEILREAFGIALDDAAETAGARLRAGARSSLAALTLPDQELDRTVFALAATAGIRLPDNPLDRMEPRAVADELARAWPRLVAALAMRRPTMLLIEDLHWAGEPLLEMLERLTARVAGPLLVVTTARPEFAQAHPGFGVGREAATSISLRPLAQPEAAALLAGLLPSAELPEQARSAIIRMAEGNPFFLEEIVLRLVDSGAIVRDEDGWRVITDAAWTSLPDTIHSLLGARIDALPPLDKRVLQEAAVVGRIFWQAPLLRALGDAAVDQALLRLEDRGLVVARPTSSLGEQTEYQFKHALVRDVAYATLPKSRRARAHAEHALWLEELAGDRRDELVELVAHHYYSAVAGEDADLAWAEDAPAHKRLRGRAFEALLAAGAAARRRFAIAKALEVHQQALSLAANDAEWGRAMAAIGDDHEANFHGDEAFEAYVAALERVRGQPETQSLRARICLMASRMAAVKWGGFRAKPTPALMEQFVDEGLEAATDEATRNWLTVLKGNVGLRWLWSKLDDPLPLSERIHFAEAGVTVAEALDAPALLSQAYRTLGLLQSMAGAWEETVQIARRDLRLADRLEPTEQAFALFWNALFLMEIAGEFAQGLAPAERSLEVARALTPHELMHGTYTVMSARYHLGHWAALEGPAGQHLQALAQEPGIGCPYARGGPLVAALALAHQGRLDRAAELASTLAPDLDQPGLPEALLARCLVARGDPRAGRELAERIVGRWIYAEENAFEILAMLDALVALEHWDALATFLPRARATSKALALIEPASDRAEGQAHAATGDRTAAEALLRRALAGFQRMGVVFETALTKEQLAAVAQDRDTARLLGNEALAIYERLQATPHAERLRAATSTPLGQP
jgi:DNA-binding SARP family transcriptional activator/tetratricopeptide (TPR) repeat protein